MGGEVESAVGGEDASEETKVVGDAVGEDGVGCGGEVDGAAGGVLLLKILQQFAVVGEVNDVQGDGCREVLLQGCFSLEEPPGELEQAGGMMTGQSQSGIDQGIGFYESSVQVYTEGVDPPGR